MLGDYNEFIRTWSEAVNSTGFAAEQVEMQLDTISRKLKQLHADTQGLFVNVGNAGLGGWLKDEIQGLDNFILGLRQIPAEMWQVTAALGKLALAVYVVSKGFDALRTSIVGANAAAMSLAKRNLIILGITAIAYAVINLVEHYGELANAERNAAQRATDNIAVKSQEIDMLNKQTEFVEAMMTARQKLIKQLDDETLSDEKRILLNSNIAATEKELTSILGDAAVQRIKDANWSQEAIESEKESFIKANDIKKREMKELISAQITATKAQIGQIESQIKAYETDASSFIESIEKKIEALGVFRAALLQMYEWQTSFYEGKRDTSQALANMLPGDPNNPEAGTWKARLQCDANEYDKLVKESQAAGAKIVSSKVNNLKSELAELRQRNVELLKGLTGDFKPTGAGGSEYTSPADKNKGAGSRNPYRIQQMLQQREVNDLFTAAKLSTDRYQESLDNLSLKEKLYGDTVENSLSNLALKAQREAELRKEQEKYNSLAKDYSAIAQEIISKDAELTEAVKTYKISLVDLSKEEWRELVGDNSYLSTLLRNIQRLTEAASEANKNANKIANEQTFAKQGRTGDFFYMSDRRIQGIQSDAKWEQSRLNQNSWMYYYDNLAIKIKSLKSVYDEYTIALERAEDELKQIHKTDNEELYDRKLKNVEELRSKTADAYTAMKNAANEAAQATKQFWADTVGDIIVQGNTLGDVMSNIWKRIATDAINQMFGIQRQGASILGTMGGKGKGKGGGINFGTSASMYATSIPRIAHNGGVIASYPKMHSGGIVPYLKNDEVIRTLQSGEEVNSRQDRRTNEMLIELMKTMAQNQSNNVIQISAIDSKSFVEYADAHADMFVNLLRKQKSMGNAI